MSDLDVRNVLAQIRTLQAQSAAQTRAVSGQTVGPANGTGSNAAPPSFGNVMEAALDRVSLTQKTAAGMQEKFQMGDEDTDLASVMLASSRAKVEFKGLVEVRNRMVRAYQDIMNMPL